MNVQLGAGTSPKWIQVNQKTVNRMVSQESLPFSLGNSKCNLPRIGCEGDVDKHFLHSLLCISVN